jgi:hypothetical protein
MRLGKQVRATKKKRSAARPQLDLTFRPRTYRWPRKSSKAGLSNEVVVARVDLSTSHRDAIALRAKRGPDGRIRYRLVHEDAHGRSNRPIRVKPASSDRPLALGELIELLDSAHYRNACSDPDDQERFGGVIWGTLQLHFEHGIEHADEYLFFTKVASEHYPQLEAHYLDRLSDWCLANCEEEEDCKKIVRLRLNRR